MELAARMTSLLDRVVIASPCSADWHSMTGDDKRRFCAQCRLHVHDLSAMTGAEAERLLRRAGEGRVCVRLFRRADGTVLTKDCPVGFRARVRRAWARAAALWLTFATSLGCTRATATPTSMPTPAGGGRTNAPAPVPPPETPAPPESGAVKMGEMHMGDVAVPRAPTGK
jgi:hypothetical protein